jgi:cytochrome b involved in lipid metabolism
MSINNQKYTFEEVSKHDQKDDCWIIIDDYVYDVTEFVEIHPGGKNMILMVAGKDATEYFHELHNENILQEIGEEYIIGELM